MYRFVDADQRPMIKGIAELVRQDNPRIFKVIDGVKPHTSILSITAAARFLSRTGVENPQDAAYRFLSRTRKSLDPESFVPTTGECVRVDVFGRSLGIVLDAPLVEAEVSTALNALKAATGQRYTNYNGEPHITLGKLSEVADERQIDDVLSAAAVICGLYLPEDRRVFLGPVTSHGPH